MLPSWVKTGTKAIVERPYGEFTFEDTAPRQIWIGGGIGITLLIARMKQLARKPGRQGVDLFHTATQLAPEARQRLITDAKAAGVILHILIDSQDGLLTGERLRAAVSDWQSASVWFCGPGGFGAALHRDFVAQGLSRAAFHQGLFNMR